MQTFSGRNSDPDMFWLGHESKQEYLLFSDYACQEKRVRARECVF